MAIPIPNLPTDNLYKFMALSGIFLMVFSFSFEQLQKQKIHKLLYEVEANLIVTDSIQALLPPNREPESENDDADVVLYREHVELVKMNKLKLREREALIEQHDNTRFPLLFLFFSGAGMAFFGFYSWYRRVQKPLDKILKLNLEKAKLEAASLKKSSATK